MDVTQTVEVSAVLSKRSRTRRSRRGDCGEFDVGTIVWQRHQIVAGADTQYKSSRNIGFAYLPQQRIRSDWISNAQIQFGPADGQWSISAFVRNIENNRTLTFASTHPTAQFLTAGQTPPRTYGVRAGVKF